MSKQPKDFVATNGDTIADLNARHGEAQIRLYKKREAASLARRVLEEAEREEWSAWLEVKNLECRSNEWKRQYDQANRK